VDPRGAGYLAFSGLIVGGLGVAAGVLSAAGVSPFSQTFWRFLLTAVIFVTVSLVLYGRETIPGKKEWRIVAVSGGLMMVASLTYIGAISLGVAVPVVSFLSQLSTIFTVLLAVPLLHEALTRAKVLVISLGTGGVFFISHPWAAVGGNPEGELLVLLNALAFASLTIFNSEFIKHRNYRPQLVSTWMFGGAALWCIPLLVFGSVQVPSSPTLNEPALLFTMALLLTFVPYSLMNLGLKRVGAGPASILLLLSSLTSVVLSYFILDEEVGVFSGIGSALIVLSVVILAFSEDRGTRRGSPPQEARPAG
jgi:drug/metabolite transporter (DMT)-like permease